jgi:hypothetical protein
LVEYLVEIKEMFGVHFQNILVEYLITNHVDSAKESCRRVVPYKVWSTKKDMLGVDLIKEDLLQALNQLKNEKSPKIDGFLGEFFKTMSLVVRKDMLHLA